MDRSRYNWVAMREAVVRTLTYNASNHCLATVAGIVTFAQAPKTHVVVSQVLNAIGGRDLPKLFAPRKKVFFLTVVAFLISVSLPFFTQLIKRMRWLNTNRRVAE